MNWQRTFLLKIVLGIGISFSAEAGNIAPPTTLLIPAGPFIMGSAPDEREAAYKMDEKAYGHSATRKGRWYENEPDRSDLKTPAYEITRTPITNAAYARFVKETGHRPPGVDKITWAGYGLIHPFERTRKFAWDGTAPPKGREFHPVVLVSHGDATAYAAWLSKKTDQNWRLPSEAEWEKAARGMEGRWFPWGDEFDPGRLNSHDQGPFDTLPVGIFPGGASPFGLLDAAGQVFEWTGDETGTSRYIVKGGSWDDKGCGVCRPAARHSRPGDLKHILIGFRLVKETNR
jgi:toxoflavin biosynthesis protein ToxD